MSNPINLTDNEWSVIQRHLPRGIALKLVPPSEHGTGDVVVTERPLGAAVEEGVDVPVSVTERTRKYREAKLVRDYEKWLGRSLVIRTAALPTGERLVVDAYDPETWRLIEAKASTSRQAIRMAIGQLLDYRRHVQPDAAHLAILLPDPPSPDIIDLLRSLEMEALVRHGKGFRFELS